MGDQVSAVPDDLMGYANAATPDDKSLASLGDAASSAIQAFLKSDPDPSVMAPIQDVGALAAAYASAKGATDQWVFDVGLAFADVANQQTPRSDLPYDDYDLGQTLVTASQSQIASSLTSNALTQMAKEDADELKKFLTYDDFDSPLQNRSGFQALIQRIISEDNDPVQLAVLFKELGPKDTLLAAHYLEIIDPSQLKQFSALLATATQSPTWDDSFDQALVHDAFYGQVQTLENQPLDPSALSGLLQSGVFSSTFLKNVGDALMPPGTPHLYIDPEQAGLVVPAFLAALARNPEAAYQYLINPGGGQSGRLPELEMMQQMYGVGEGPPPSSWMTALGAATLAANTWIADGQAPPGAALNLLHDLAATDWQDVPDSFRGTVLQVVEQNLGLFRGHDGPYLSEADQESLITLAVTDDGGNTDSTRLAALQSAIALYLVRELASRDLNNPNEPLSVRLDQWKTDATLLMALPTLGHNVGAESEAELKEQTEEMLQLVVAVAGAFQPELEPEALGLSAASGKVLNALLDFGEDKYVKEPLEEKLLDLFYPQGDQPSGAAATETVGELTVASLLFAQDPSWLPGSPTDPGTARSEIADLVRIATNPNGSSTYEQQIQQFVQAHPGTTQTEADQAVTQLESIGGLWTIGITPTGGGH